MRSRGSNASVADGATATASDRRSGTGRGTVRGRQINTKTTDKGRRSRTSGTGTGASRPLAIADIGVKDDTYSYSVKTAKTDYNVHNKSVYNHKHMAGKSILRGGGGGAGIRAGESMAGKSILRGAGAGTTSLKPTQCGSPRGEQLVHNSGSNELTNHDEKIEKTNCGLERDSQLMRIQAATAML